MGNSFGVVVSQRFNLRLYLGHGCLGAWWHFVLKGETRLEGDSLNLRRGHVQRDDSGLWLYEHFLILFCFDNNVLYNRLERLILLFEILVNSRQLLTIIRGDITLLTGVDLLNLLRSLRLVDVRS